MSAPMNAGVVTANKPFSDEAIEIIKEIFGEPRKWYWEILPETGEIEFVEYYEYDFAEYLDELRDKLSVIGYELTGSVSYYGDWGDGRIDINGDAGVELIEKEDFNLHDATDEELIEILESRGYKVTKGGD